MSIETFNRERAGYSNVEVCKLASEVPSGAHGLGYEVYNEYRARGLDPDKCAELKRIYAESDSRQSSTAAGVAVAVVAVGLLALLAKGARSNGGTGTTGASASPGGIGIGSSPSRTMFTASPLDFDWEWDQFYNQWQQLVWACRGVQTGQFAPEEKCNGKLKLDWKWPGPTFKP